MKNDNQDRVSRRRFLQSLSALGLAGVSGSLLAACGGGGDGDSGSSTASGGQTATADASCNDLSALSDAQKQQRQQMAQSLNYVEESPEEGKYCNNCQLYKQPAEGDSCGGCQLFPGPVAPKGYCTSWAPMT